MEEKSVTGGTIPLKKNQKKMLFLSRDKQKKQKKVIKNVDNFFFTIETEKKGHPLLSLSPLKHGPVTITKWEIKLSQTKQK